MARLLGVDLPRNKRVRIAAAPQTGCDLREYIGADKISFYVKQGLLADDVSALRTTINGRLLLNKLTAELLN